MRGGLVSSPVASPEVRPAPTFARRAEQPRAVPRTDARVRPSALLYVVAGLILTDVWRLHDLFPVGRAMRPIIVLIALGLILVAVRGPAPHVGRRLRSPIPLLFLALAALTLAGLPFSLDPGDAGRAFLTLFLPHAMVGLLVAVSVRTVRDAEFLAGAALVGAVIHTAFVNVTVPVGLEGRWTQLPHYDVNDLALMLVVMIPLTLYFMRAENSTTRRFLAGACFALFAYSIVRTGSRGGFLGFAVVLGYLILSYRAVPARARLAGAIVAVVAIAIGGQTYLSRIGTIVRPSQDYNFGSETGRLAIWRRGVGYVTERPVLGLGVGQFSNAERRLWSVARQQRMTGRRAPPARGAHNMLLQVGAELGLPALVVFVVLLAATWRTLNRLRNAPTRDGSPCPALAGALAASVLGFVVCGMFLHAASFPVLPTLLGFAVALAAVCGSGAYLPPPRRGGLA